MSILKSQSITSRTFTGETKQEKKERIYKGNICYDLKGMSVSTLCDNDDNIGRETSLNPLEEHMSMPLWEICVFINEQHAVV